MLSKAIKEDASGWMKFGDAFNPIKPTSSPLHENAYKAGFQFTEWLAPNNVKVSIQVDPWYDDPVRNKVRHPLGGVAQSYRFDIWDIGTSNEPNIQKCAIANSPERRGYEWGPFANPFTGQTNNMSAGYDEDSAVIHKMATLGVCVIDPSRTMSFIPSILQG